MKTKRDALSKIVQDLTVKLYEQAQKDQAAKGGDANATGADNQSGDNKGGDDDTINGQYKDVNDQK